MTQDDLSNRITLVVARVAKVKDPAVIESDKDLYRDIGVKSTAALDLLLSLEEEFIVTIPDQEFGDARTVSSLADLIGGLT
jgi:acyl carrier protein